MPLKKWDITIYRGILTGYNEGFLINRETRDELVSASPKNAEIIRPILRGRDIDKYAHSWANKWLLYIPWHFPLQNDKHITGASELAEDAFSEQFPAIYSYLLKFKNQLANRNRSETGIRYEWYALQRWGSNYWKDFDKPKIVWKRIGSVIRFCYDDSNMICLDSACFATGSDLKYLLGYLNSKVSISSLLENSPKTGTGDVIISVQALQPLLIPNTTEENKRKIVEIVNQCIDLKIQNKLQDVTNLEKKIDEIFYEILDFTLEEIDYTERNFISSLSN